MLSEILKNYLLILGVLLVSTDHLHQSVLILSISLFLCCLSRSTGGESKKWPYSTQNKSRQGSQAEKLDLISASLVYLGPPPC